MGPKEYATQTHTIESKYAHKDTKRIELIVFSSYPLHTTLKGISYSCLSGV